jgi:hypothetical protein
VLAQPADNYRGLAHGILARVLLYHTIMWAIGVRSVPGVPLSSVRRLPWILLLVVSCGGKTMTDDTNAGGVGGAAQGGSLGSGGMSGATGGTSFAGGNVGSGGAIGTTGGSASVGGWIGSAGSAGDTVGVGGSTATCGVIRASDYDRSCVTAQDCTTIFEGDTCASWCTCPDFPISRAAAQRYHPVFAHPNKCACVTQIPACIGGICTILYADAGAGSCGPISTSGLDKSCTTTSDCIAVFEGDTCSVCPCPNASINKTAAASYQPIIPPGPKCQCAMFGVPACLSGTVSGICKFVPSPSNL